MVEQGYYSNRIKELEERKIKITAEIYANKLTLKSIDEEIEKCDATIQKLGQPNYQEVIKLNSKINNLKRDLTEKDNEITYLNNEMVERDNEIKKLKKTITIHKDEKDKLNNEIKKLNNEIDEKNEKILNLTVAVENLKKRHIKLKEENLKLKRKLQLVKSDYDEKFEIRAESIIKENMDIKNELKKAKKTIKNLEQKIISINIYDDVILPKKEVSNDNIFKKIIESDKNDF